MWVWYTSFMSAWDGHIFYAIRLNSLQYEREGKQAPSAAYMMIPGTYAQMHEDYS